MSKQVCVVGVVEQRGLDTPSEDRCEDMLLEGEVLYVTCLKKKVFAC